MAKAGPRRPVRVDGDVAYISLTRGQTAIVDVADLPMVQWDNWAAHPSASTFYAVAKRRSSPGEPLRTVQMHRVVFASEERVDHIDGDGLNNRRSNLRAATVSQNGCNRPAQANNRSGFKGVYWHSAVKKWAAAIKVGRVRKYLGCYDRPEEAHRAYIAAANELHGEFARSE